MTNPIENPPIIFESRISYPDDGPLNMPLSWERPVFSAFDAIGEEDLATHKGQVLAVGYITQDGPSCIGSGVMIAPGLLLTASHVLDELKGKDICAFSFMENRQMRVWALYYANAFRGHVETIPGQLPRSRRSDVAVASCLPASENAGQWPLVMGEVELAIPRIGERLWAVGFREEIGSNGETRMTRLCSSGRVTSFLRDGRGDHLPGPIVEVAMDARGGMSGGPVFNEAGHIVGVVSSSIGWEGGNGPTYVSLVWTAAVTEVIAPWPKHYWPKELASLQLGAESSRARLRGSAKHVNGNLTVQLADKGNDYILERLGSEYSRILEENRERLAEEGDNDFYSFLEDEGQESLRTLAPKRIVDGIYEKEVRKLFAGALKFDADCYEGCEDTSILSIEMLENGDLNVDVTFNLRGIVLTVTLNRFDFEERRGELEAAPWCWETEEYEDTVDVVFGARPHFRAGFTFAPSTRECSEFTVYAVRLKV